MFEEEKHPRDGDGKFTDKEGTKRSGYDSRDDLNNIRNASENTTKKTQTGKIVKVNMDTEIQKQFDNATPKERTKIAYKYIMDSLRGRYPAEDGRIVAIEKVGAKKISHTLFEPKIRVTPELKELIGAGQLEAIKDVEHKIFKKFAYYKVSFNFGGDIYNAVLNVGIRENGDSTLYEINQFERN